MKITMPTLSKDTVLEWLLDHGEKIVGTATLLLACWLAWGGLAALRSQSASEKLGPEKIVARAGEALAHIDRQPEPPPEKLLEPLGLADSIDTWLSPAEKDPRTLVLSRPLFDELAKRTQPEVFPVEDLQAVAGVAVLGLPANADMDGGRQPRPGFRPPPPFDPLAGEMGIDQQPDPAENVPPAKIVPYVIVTGLIPHEKQAADYLGRFETASFRDPQRDRPLWSDFLIERADVTNGPTEKWERINPKAVAQAAQREWAGAQPDSLPPEFFLAPEEQPGLGDIVYGWPLPQLAMESWGPEAIHPWALAEWQRRLAEQAAVTGGIPGSLPQPLGQATTPFGAGGGLPSGMGSPFSAPGLGMEPLFDPQSGLDAAVDQLEYRLFRFVDTAVKTGRAYRYRVRISVWNPNHDVPAQHLAQADLAKATKLPSPPSNETTAVSVPGPMGVLARMLPVDPKQRDSAEVLVLWPHEKTGNFALHSVTAAPGGMVSVQRKIPQEEGDDRGRGKPGRGKQEPATEPVPVGMLVDFIGQQVADQANARPTAARRGKKSAPAEPFELLMLGEDGQLRWASPISSDERYRLYADTLPSELRGIPAGPLGPDGEPEPLFPGFR